ncbi:hypothetical protein TRAPUB_5329 [Trametes pubescens]|uniref:F-box domain-containing protein n=1 Tax=Trametes pubescens TaxID=154538 RepID=A0A1M2V8N6_TRAPU|nr:hypothetical protein TRAPUB_5329 [Trametes pubescens]
MDTLPLELHAQIFALACSDDGSTAHALALVSTYVREVAAPYRYQSLVISGMEQMSALVSRLDATPPHLRRVRNLFLSDWTRAQTKERVMRTSEDAQDRYLLEKTLALRILTLAASTLETLAVMVACPYTGPPLLGALFSTPMPRLIELTVHGFYPFPHAPRVMPRLERLHLSGNRNPHGLLELGSLDSACPSLTHLHVSGLVAATAFADELRSALLRQSPSLETSLENAAQRLSPFLASLPPLLRHITMETRPLDMPMPRRSRIQYMHAKMVDALKELQGRGDIPARVSVVEGSEDEDVYSGLHRDWQSRLTR